MGLWSDRALPHIVDKACGTGDIMKRRATACEGLHGRVLEIGFGSGHDVAFHPAAVTEVATVEPADVAGRMSEQRREASGVPVEPGGSFHFLEHGRAPTDGVQTWQRRLEPVQRRLFGGCHLTRHVPSLLAEAGCEVVELEEDYLPGPGFAKPFIYGYVGRAVLA